VTSATLNDDLYTVVCEVLDNYQRRRFTLPEAIMSTLFPDGVYRVTKTLNEMKFIIRDMYDKTADTTIENVNWKQSFLDSL